MDHNKDYEHSTIANQPTDYSLDLMGWEGDDSKRCVEINSIDRYPDIEIDVHFEYHNWYNCAHFCYNF